MEPSWIDRASSIAVAGIFVGLSTSLVAGYVQWRIQRQARLYDLLERLADEIGGQVEAVRVDIDDYWSSPFGADGLAERITINLSGLYDLTDQAAALSLDVRRLRDLWDQLHETGTGGNFGNAVNGDDERRRKCRLLATKLRNELSDQLVRWHGNQSGFWDVFRRSSRRPRP